LLGEYGISYSTLKPEPVPIADRESDDLIVDDKERPGSSRPSKSLEGVGRIAELRILFGFSLGVENHTGDDTLLTNSAIWETSLIASTVGVCRSLSVESIARDSLEEIAGPSSWWTRES